MIKNESDHMGLIGTLSLLSCILVVCGSIRGPQGEIVPQQLHDERGILVRVLIQSIELSNSIIEGLK